MKKLVLAYSGGLDTSYCVKHLSQLGYEVHAVSVNTGGFDAEEVKSLSAKAMALGATSYESIDAVDIFYQKVIRFLVFGNVLKNNTYPLSVSAERIIQAVEIVNYAKSIGATHIAHGSTGAGNDQVRFDLIFQTLAPNIEIITPIRDQKLSREDEISFLKSTKDFGVRVLVEKKRWNRKTRCQKRPTQANYPNSNQPKLLFSLQKGNYLALTASKWMRFLPFRRLIKSPLVMRSEEISTLGIRLLGSKEELALKQLLRF
jgi:argininosuccinate synthase